jgi:hypothetical protein
MTKVKLTTEILLPSGEMSLVERGVTADPHSSTMSSEGSRTISRSSSRSLSGGLVRIENVQVLEAESERLNSKSE